MSVDQVKELRTLADQFGAQLVLAGSLRSSDWPSLEQIGPVTIGVRGAVCESSADRTTQLSPGKVLEWIDWCERKE